MRDFVNQVCFTRDQVSLYLWLIGLILKRKFSKYYDHNSLNLNLYSSFWKNTHFAQKKLVLKNLPVSGIRKTPTRKIPTHQTPPWWIPPGKFLPRTSHPGFLNFTFFHYHHRYHWYYLKDFCNSIFKSAKARLVAVYKKFFSLPTKMVTYILKKIFLVKYDWSLL